MTLEAILIAVAIGVLVPVALLIGPYLPYLLPYRDRLPDPAANRFAEVFAKTLHPRREDDPHDR